VTIEFEHGAPLIVDRLLYRELVKQAIARTVSELEARVADQAAERQAGRSAKRSEPADRSPRPSGTSAGSCASAAARARRQPRPRRRAAQRSVDSGPVRHCRGAGSSSYADVRIAAAECVAMPMDDAAGMKRRAIGVRDRQHVDMPRLARPWGSLR
jgi:hypothetical protein